MRGRGLGQFIEDLGNGDVFAWTVLVVILLVVAITGIGIPLYRSHQAKKEEEASRRLKRKKKKKRIEEDDFSDR